VTQKNQTTLRVAGRDAAVSNLNKVEVGFTKCQVIDYYTQVARYILPHLKDRPITMKRFPNGINGQYISDARKRQWSVLGTDRLNALRSSANRLADRRMILAGYRLADLLTRVLQLD
jgi:DNA primase